MFHSDESLLAMRDIVYRYRQESRQAASAGAFSAAVTILGAAIEGTLALRCLKSEKKAKSIARQLVGKAKLHNPDDVMKWSFDNLVNVCDKAGWLSPINRTFAVVQTAALVSVVRKMRNLVHPGKAVREIPWSEIGQAEYDYCVTIDETISAVLKKQI